jgi:hypothetical protein
VRGRPGFVVIGRDAAGHQVRRHESFSGLEAGRTAAGWRDDGLRVEVRPAMPDHVRSAVFREVMGEGPP